MKTKRFKLQFEHLLNSTLLSSNSTQKEYNRVWNDINNVIRPNIPPLLYRFRRCSDRSIISFERGQISTCVAETFNDKYDSNIFVDKTSIESSIKKTFDLGVIKELYDSKEDGSLYSMIEPIFGKDLTEEFKKLNLNTSDEQKLQILNYDYWKQLIENVKEAIDFQVDYIRKDKFTKVACFTENIQSKSMWDLYADGYSGFALGYDFRHFHEKGCLSCLKMDCNYEYRNYNSIFPVIYSNTRYNATNEVLCLVLRQHVSSMFKKSESFIPPINQLHWYKSYLFKEKKEYQREKEWRLICHFPNGNDENYTDVSDCGCLKSIYYGPDIDKYYKIHLRDVAKLNKIKEFDVSIDENSQKYKLKITPIS